MHSAALLAQVFSKAALQDAVEEPQLKLMPNLAHDQDTRPNNIREETPGQIRKKSRSAHQYVGKYQSCMVQNGA
eukprot:COSAG05_NODE_2048_length_3640_cov_5.415619_2_plen_74_part_00